MKARRQKTEVKKTEVKKSRTQEAKGTATTADEIAEMASRGEDVSAYFSNKFTAVRPVRGVDVSS